MKYPPLEDYIAIVALLNRYASAVNARDSHSLADCFTEGAAVDLPVAGRHQGSRVIAEAIIGLQRGLDGSHLLVSNVVVETVEDEVRVTSYFQATHYKAGAEGGSTLTTGGRYRDVVVNQHGTWQMKYRTLERMWSTGNSSLLPPRAERASAAEPL